MEFMKVRLDLSGRGSVLFGCDVVRYVMRSCYDM